MKATRILFVGLICLGFGCILLLKQVEIKPVRSAELLARTNYAPQIETQKEPYIEVVDSCGPHFEGRCLRVRDTPSLSGSIMTVLRTGVVLHIATSTIIDDKGMRWYEVVFNEWIRYPERIGQTRWFVAAPYVRLFYEDIQEQSATASSSKRILILRSQQKLYAYDGDSLFLESSISTGLDLTPTPRGNFTIYAKTPSRYMQGPLPGISDEYYDLPGVPWDLYFTKEGGAIHGSYWHTAFGTPRSHGCVNLPIPEARRLYRWASIGTRVTVRD